MKAGAWTISQLGRMVLCPSSVPGALDTRNASTVVRRAFVCLAIVLSLPAIVRGGTVSVSGRCEYIARDGSPQPIRWARVSLFDNEPPPLLPVLLATVHTHEDGSYSFPDIDNDDGPSEAGLDIFVRVYCDYHLTPDRCAVVTNADILAEPYSWNTPVYGDVPDGAIPLGTLTVNTDTTAWRIYDAARRAYEFFRFDAPTPWNNPKVTIVWPVEDRTEFHPFNYQIHLPDESVTSWEDHTIYHEYSHAVMYKMYGNAMPFTTYSLLHGNDHSEWTESDHGWALSEGWAEFSADLIRGDALDEALFDTSHYADRVDNDDYDGSIIEGAVAEALWDIADGGACDDDAMNNGLSHLISILIAHHPNSILDVRTQWQVDGYPNIEALDRILYSAKIVEPQFSFIRFQLAPPGLWRLFSGPEGGPFVPTQSSPYYLENISSQTCDWAASASESWVSVVPSQGRLAPGEVVAVQATLNSDANVLPASDSDYSARVDFHNLTDSGYDLAGTCASVTVVPPPPGQPPVATVVSISPNPANQSAGNDVAFVGDGEDPDDPGNPLAITTYRWTSNLGTTSGNLELHNRSEASFVLAAADLVLGQHTITLQVQDDQGEWSDPVQAMLEILPGSPEGNLVLYSPTAASPVLLSPGGFYCADVEWDLSAVPEFNPTVGIEVQIAMETTSGWYISLSQEPLYDVQDRRLFCSLPTLPGSYTGLRDLRVQIRDAATSSILLELEEPDALMFDPGQSSPDFTLSPNPTSRSASSPGSAQFDIIANYSNGYSSPITLSLGAGLPQGVTGNFSPNPLVPPAQISSLTLNIPSGVPGSNYQFSVIGSGGGLTRAVAPAPVVEIPGEALTITLLEFVQDPSNPEVLSIHYRLEGTPGTYYHIRWQFLLTGNQFLDIQQAQISGANPVSCPGDHWLHWTMTGAPNNLDGLEGTAFFKMQVSSTSDGGLTATQVGSTFPYVIWGLTWDGSSSFYATTRESGGIEKRRRFNTSFGEIGGSCSLPLGGGIWAAAYNQPKLWVVPNNTSDQIHRLNPSNCSPDSSPQPFEGAEAGGFMWADTGYYADGIAPWFTSGGIIRLMTFISYESPPEMVEVQRWNIPTSSAHGAAFDGNFIWVCDADNPRLIALDPLAMEPAEDRIFSTANFTGGGNGPTDVAYANGYLWAPARFSQTSKVFRVTPPTLSQRVQASFQFDLNEPPGCSVTSPVGAQSGDLTVAYTLSDRESDSLSIGMEYSTNNGLTWVTCSLAGQTGGIGPGSYVGSVVWTSATNLPDYDSAIRLRLTARDTDAGSACVTESFTLANETPFQNHAPDMPQNRYPLANQVDVVLTPPLIASPFSDVDTDDVQASSRFVIRTDSGDYASPLWDSGDLQPSTTFVSVPTSAGLELDSVYWWRCRYEDSYGAWSAWSSETRFTIEPPCDDDDDDGVCNDQDDCPTTAAGDPVDANGCSTADDDGDGVLNDQDICPGTPACAPVDSNGCPSDTDGDGVYNGCDNCPNTPSCASVDAVGCPNDSDADGVLNGCDQCPNTPSGQSVDPSGCSCSQLDDDNDGVDNCIDQCPNTPPGVPVDANGCSCADLDDDGDGVNNCADQCPGFDDTLDDDADGVPNGCDNCPNTPSCASVNASGCPSDSDGDGVYNGCDNCPSTPTCADVDGNGCPSDSDGDGVLNGCEGPTTSPSPDGVCCLSDGSCEVKTQVECSAVGGTYQGDNSTCNPCGTGICGGCGAVMPFMVLGLFWMKRRMQH